LPAPKVPDRRVFDIAEFATDHEQLGGGGVMRHEAVLHLSAPDGIVLLENEDRPGNVCRGVLHRSPALTSAHPLRIIAALDALFQGLCISGIVCPADRLGVRTGPGGVSRPHPTE
jgi:hypothetical protein